MNARLYDAKLHRFLAPDSFIQDPGNPQNYNLYGYVLNNPLKYTDPSGNVWHIVIGAVIGGVVNWATHGAQFNAKGLGYFGIGAGVGALAAFTGGGVTSVLGGGSFMAGALGSSAAGIGSGFISGAIGGFVTGSVSGFSLSLANSMYEGNSFKNSLDVALKSALVSGTISAVTAGLISGSMASEQGLNFWTGEGTSSMIDTGLYYDNGSGPVEYSNESLNNFVENNPELKRYTDIIDDISIETPPGYKFSEYNGTFYKYDPELLKNTHALGVTHSTGAIFKTINVYIARKTFMNSAQLYMTTQHEFFHAYFYYYGYLFTENQEHMIINQWEHEQYKIWKGQSGFLNPMPHLAHPYGDLIRGQEMFFNHFSKFGFRTINYKP